MKQYRMRAALKGFGRVGREGEGCVKFDSGRSSVDADLGRLRFVGSAPRMDRGMFANVPGKRRGNCSKEVSCRRFGQM